MNADLHCHSVISDGTMTPEALASRAKSNGVTLWALTDHDEVAGLQRAREAALEQQMDYLTGTEISVTFADMTVHIVGLGFDAADPVLKHGLEQTRSGRTQRAQEIALGLSAVGIKGAYEGALQYVGNPELISRTHFARFLVDAGLCHDTSHVFQKFLVRGKPGFVPHQWARLKDAVQWITGAGGVAVIAHPGRYRLTPNEEYALFNEFKAHGGSAVEVITGSHTPSDYQKYTSIALEFNLWASRGSDFHSPDESRTDFGCLPALPETLRPVWRLLEEQIIRH